MTSQLREESATTAHARESNSKGNLFPLALTAFESFLLADDRPDYPMTFSIEIVLSGTLSHEPFRQAVQEASGRHPLLRAVVQRRGRSHHWSPTDIPPPLAWSTAPRFASRSIDIRRQPGLRIFVRVADDLARVQFQFHHVATDGLGAMAFIGDVLALYGQATAAPDEEMPQLTELEPDRLRSRGQLWPCKTPLWRWLPRMLIRMTEMAVRLPASLRGHAESRLTEDAPPEFFSRLVERPFLMALKHQARRRNVSLNDLCTAALFQTLQKWHDLQPARQKGHWFRLAIPVSLRTPLHDNCPAANIVSYMIQSRRPRQCTDFDETLRYCSTQAAMVVGGVDSRLFALFTDVLRRVPGLLSLFVKTTGCLSTAVMTNVGDVRRQFRARFPLRKGKCVAGSVTLEALRGTAPLRPGTHLAAALGTYAGQLYINMRCDPSCFTCEDSERLIDLYLMQLAAIAEYPRQQPAVLERTRPTKAPAHHRPPLHEVSTT